MKDFLLGLLDWIYKKKCYFCKSSKESVRMCSKCFDELEFLPVEVNRKVFKSEVYCAGVYDKNLQYPARLYRRSNQYLFPVNEFLNDSEFQ